ncbi:hypothetical protein BO85DRAFT_276364 [Aspergillus piperis CBS 112811]|uniref:Uncharacterized protein n=1 Tax=Aspergillus piperis CBS 112811 TaxID=1448313 RepID=A0A8G1R331_9EURO|nr:hypothetical protein BO85DRAFT_276364 [Aspergillus piperis CBS 112811]RAH58539.1 hypothetical protein BO85DRAFT_276364 [Aspergillus piperis CBS 112811]
MRLLGVSWRPSDSRLAVDPRSNNPIGRIRWKGSRQVEKSPTTISNCPAGKTHACQLGDRCLFSCDPLALALLRLQESYSSPKCPSPRDRRAPPMADPYANAWMPFYKMSAPETRVQRQSSTACLSHATILRPTRRSFESRHHLAGRLPGLCVLWIQPGSDGGSPHAGVVCGDVSPDEHFDHHWGPAALQLHHSG